MIEAESASLVDGILVGPEGEPDPPGCFADGRGLGSEFDSFERGGACREEEGEEGEQDKMNCEERTAN